MVKKRSAMVCFVQVISAEKSMPVRVILEDLQLPRFREGIPYWESPPGGMDVAGRINQVYIQKSENM